MCSSPVFLRQVHVWDSETVIPLYDDFSISDMLVNPVTHVVTSMLKAVCPSPLLGISTLTTYELNFSVPSLPLPSGVEDALR